MANTKPLQDKVFSTRLETWLNSSSPKTLERLNKVFAEKSIGIIIFVLMFLPALPLPTGGVSHVFEIVALLLSLQLVIGRRTIWFPERWKKRRINGLGEKKTVLYMLRFLHWLEKFSRPRMARVLRSRAGLVIAGVVLSIYSLAAFLAPPFSGLDTLPAAGACLVALSLVLDDIVIFFVGVAVGVLGIIVSVGLGTVLVQFLHHLSALV